MTDTMNDPKFPIGTRVRKIKGSSWHGCVVGFYSTELTPRGYAVESEREPGSVQIYPEAALEIFHLNKEKEQPRCRKCNDHGYWWGGADQCISYPCDCQKTGETP